MGNGRVGEPTSGGAMQGGPCLAPSPLVRGGRAISGPFLDKLQGAQAEFVLKMCTFMLGDSPWARFNEEDILNDGACGRVHVLQTRAKLTPSINNVTGGFGFAIKTLKTVRVPVGPAGKTRRSS